MPARPRPQNSAHLAGAPADHNVCVLTDGSGLLGEGLGGTGIGGLRYEGDGESVGGAPGGRGNGFGTREWGRKLAAEAARTSKCTS